MKVIDSGAVLSVRWKNVYQNGLAAVEQCFKTRRLILTSRQTLLFLSLLTALCPFRWIFIWFYSTPIPVTVLTICYTKGLWWLFCSPLTEWPTVHYPRERYILLSIACFKIWSTRNDFFFFCADIQLFTLTCKQERDKGRNVWLLLARSGWRHQIQQIECLLLLLFESWEFIET